jgi:excisionase family DNA binding protein
MAQFYTLEEAARVLGMSPEDLKNKAQQREIRAFLDGGSWRFRVVDVDELARQRGLGSDAELRLSDLDAPGGAGSQTEVGEIDLSEFPLGSAGADVGAETVDFGQYGESSKGWSSSASGSEHDILLDDSTVPPGPMAGSSSVILGMTPTGKGKQPSDSDVKLVPDNVKGASDSDVRLATPTPSAPSDSDVTLIKDDSADHDLFGTSASNETQLGPSPFLDSSDEIPAHVGGDSDFELNPSSVIDALQPDSGSDFELSALDESDEYESIPRPKPSDSDVTAGNPNLSGINLSRPSDSGINLQSASGFGRADLTDSIELAPLEDDDSGAPPAPTRPAPAKPKSLMSDTQMSASPIKKGAADKDIFDDTDFEVDAPLIDDSSDDQTVQLEAASDFELEESDTGSEVFAVDEEEVDQNAATAMGPSSFAEEDDEEDDGFDEAVSTEMASAWSAEASAPSSMSAGPAMVMQRDVSPEWGGVMVGMLGATTFLLLLMSFLSLDLMRNLYDFQENSPASGLVSSIAGLFFQ